MRFWRVERDWMPPPPRSMKRTSADWMLTGPQFDYWSGTSAHTGKSVFEEHPDGYRDLT